MPTNNTRGIVLNHREFLEKDKIVTILDIQGYKKDYVAKGARNIKSRKSSQIETLNYLKFSAAKGRSIDILLEVSTINSIAENIKPQNINFLFYFAEIINKIYTTDEEHENVQEIFILRELFSDYIYHSILKLQLLMIDQLGNIPDLLSCQETGKDLKAERFSRYNQIGYFKTASNGKQISDRILKIQLFLLNNHAREIVKLQIEKDDFNNLITLQNDWIECIIEKEVKSFNLLFL